MHDELTQRAIAHTVLPVEVRGDTLVMRPAGDVVGFNHHEFVAERDRVKALLQPPPASASTLPGQPPRYRNLIVDLSGSAYFGSEMIGSLVDLRKAVPEDGVMALCGLSTDMEAGLRVMHLDQMWMTFGDTEEAVRAIATQSWTSRMLRHRKKFAVAAIALLVLLGIGILLYTSVGYRIIGSPGERDYRRIAKLYRGWDQLVDNRAGAEELAQHSLAIRPKLSDFVYDTAASVGNFPPGRARVVTAARLFEQNMTTKPDPAFGPDFELEMARARLLLQDELGYQIEPLIDEPDEVTIEQMYVQFDDIGAPLADHSSADRPSGRDSEALEQFAREQAMTNGRSQHGMPLPPSGRPLRPEEIGYDAAGRPRDPLPPEYGRSNRRPPAAAVQGEGRPADLTPRADDRALRSAPIDETAGPRPPAAAPAASGSTDQPVIEEVVEEVVAEEVAPKASSDAAPTADRDAPRQAARRRLEELERSVQELKKQLDEE